MEKSKLVLAILGSWSILKSKNCLFICTIVVCMKVKAAARNITYTLMIPKKYDPSTFYLEEMGGKF